MEELEAETLEEKKAGIVLAKAQARLMNAQAAGIEYDLEREKASDAKRAAAEAAAKAAEETDKPLAA